MRNLFICTLALSTILFSSCSKDEPTTSGFIKANIVNRWVTTNLVNDYKSREFREDGIYIHDGSNLNLGSGTGSWYWGNGDSLWISFVENNATPQVHALLVTKLSQDSLVFKQGTDIHRYFRQ